MLVSIMHKHIHDGYILDACFQVSHIHVSMKHDGYMMHISVMYACVFDACMYDPCMMHIFLILIHACIHDAYICDAAEILLQTNRRTDKAILGVG